MKLIDRIISGAFKYGLTRSRLLGKRLEIAYWNRVEIPEWKLDPNLELDVRMLDLLPDKTDVRILDVGAGVLTTVGKKYQDKKIHLTPIDPLAKDYSRILKKRGLQTDWPTQSDSIERLEDRSFDIVFARNSIDHSEDPLQMMSEMIRVCRGHVLMEHLINVGQRENYRGLHQWNYSLSPKGELWLWNKRKKNNLSDTFPDIENEVIEENGLLWIVTRIDCRNEHIPRSEPSPEGNVS